MPLHDEKKFEFSHELILTIQPSGLLCDGNAPALAALGLEEADIASHNLRDWLSLNSIEEWETCLEAAAAGVPVNGANITLRTRTDPELMVEAKLQPSGDLIVVYLRSLNERQRVRQALQESEGRLRTVLTALPDLVMVFDQTGRYREIYTGETAILAAPADEMMGKSLHEIVSPDEAEAGLAQIRHVIETQQASQFEHALVIRGKRRWFSAKVVPFRTEHDPQVLWVSRDVTSLVLARRQKDRDERLLRDLLDLEQKSRSVVAYEIHDGFMQYAVGTQMWLQCGLEQLAHDQAEAREALETALDSVEQAVNEARSLIGDLRPDVMDEDNLIRGVRHLVEEMQKKSTATIAFVCHSEPPPLLHLLETQIFRMVQESLNNVIRHSHATRAEVQLSVVNDDADEDHLLLTISDNGRGFDPDNIPRGHYGVEGILRRTRVFDGRGTIDSKPGVGTKVTIRLPLLEPETK